MSFRFWRGSGEQTETNKPRTFNDIFLVHKQKLKDFHKRYLVIRIDRDFFRNILIYHPHYISAVGILLIIILALNFSGFARASVAKFYPTSCLGGWEHPENVEGSPSLTGDANSSDFTLENSAHMGTSSSYLYCGGFKGEIPENSKPTKFSVSLALSIDDGSVTHDTPEPFPEPIPESNVDENNGASGSDVENLGGSPLETIIIPPDTTDQNLEDTPIPEPEPQPSPEANQPVDEEADQSPAEPPEPSNDIQSLLFRLTPASLMALVEGSAPDPFLEVDYTLDGTNWSILGNISRSSWQNNSFDIPLDQWTNLDNLQIAVKTLPTYDDPSEVYLDSIAVSVDYDDLEKLNEPPTVILKDGTRVISSQKTDFASVEQPTFVITNPNLDTSEIKTLIDDNQAEIVSDPNGALSEPTAEPQSEVDQSPAESNPVSFFLFKIQEAFAADVSLDEKPAITASVLDAEGDETGIIAAVETVLVDGVEQQQVKVEKPEREFRPGRYTLKISIATPEATLISQQDFTWGVLAVNLNKSVYIAGDDAYFQMGVLNDQGRTLCNAYLNLDIVSPSGSVTRLTTDDSIVSASECAPDNIITVPDYYTHFTIPDESGTYSITLTANTKNGTKSVTDSFEVVTEASFNIDRTGPTRINPKAVYPMTLRVTSDTDWTGTIIEKVPASFTISEPENSVSYNELSTEGDTQLITFHVSLSAGIEKVLGYHLKAPDVSPEFYLLGAAEFRDVNNEVAFTESRHWQIASDATCTLTNGAGTWTWDGAANVAQAGHGTATWTGCTTSPGSTPSTGDTIQINSGQILNITATASVGAITIATPTVANGLIVSDGATVTVSGALNLQTNATAITETVTLGTGAGAGNLTVGSISIAAPTGAVASNEKITCFANAAQSGTLTVSGAGTITITGSSIGSNTGLASIDMSPGACKIVTGTVAGTVLTIAGGTTGATPAALLKMGTGTLTMNGNLAFTGATASKAQFNMAAGGTLVLNAAALPVVGTPGVYTFPAGSPQTNLTSTGASSIAYATAVTTFGALNVNSGTLTLNGANETFTSMTIASGAILTTTKTLSNSGNLTCGSGGTATISGAAGAVTMTGASAQLISTGTCNITATGTVTISGATSQVTSGSTYSIVSMTVNNTTTNNGTLSVTTTLAGSSTLTNGNSATLNIGAVIANFTLTTLAATGTSNTVNYNGAVQTLKPISYVNLGLTAAGNKTMTGITTISGNFTATAGTTVTTTFVATSIGGNVLVNGGTITDTGANLVVTGSTTVSSGAMTQGAFTYQTAGLTVSGGTFTVGGAAFTNTSTSTISLGTLTLSNSTGNKQFNGLVSVSGGTMSGTSTTVIFQNGITQSTGTVNLTGTQTFNTNTNVLTGTMTLGTIVASTAVTNNATVTTAGTTNALTCTGVWTQGSGSSITFSGTAVTFSGCTGAQFIANSVANTVTYSGVAQTCLVTQYWHLTFSGSGAKTCTPTSPIKGDLTMAGTTSAWVMTTDVTVSGNLAINSSGAGGLTTGAAVFLVTGTTGISGGTLSLTDSTATKTKTLTGLVTLTGGTLSGATTLATFRGGITNTSGTVSLTGTDTFDTNDQTLTGTMAIANITSGTSGKTVTNSGTITSSGTAFVCTGAWLQNTGSSLIFSGAIIFTNCTGTGATSLDAHTNANTINYSRSGVQTCLVTQYRTLTFSGTSLKTCLPTSPTLGGVTLSGTASWTTGNTQVINGDVNVGDGTTLALGAFTLTIGGNTTIGGVATGIFTGTSGTGLTLNGNLTLNVGSTWTKMTSGNLTFSGGVAQSITDNTAATQDLGAVVTATTSTAVTTMSSTKMTSLNIAGSTTWDITNDTMTLTGTGGTTPLTVSGTFTITGSTVVYTGATATVTATTFNNLTLGGTGTYTFPAAGGNITLRGNLSIPVGTTSITKGTGTIIFAVGGGGSQSVTDSEAVKKDLGNIQVSANSGNSTLNLGSNILATNITIDAAQILDATATPFNITLNGSWTNNGGTPGFNARSGTVTLATTSTATITGTTTFNNFIASNIGGAKNVIFQHQTANSPIFTFGGTVTLAGASSQILTIDSDLNGTQWLAHFNSTQSGTFLSVQDSGCDAGSSVVTTDSTSTLSTNNGFCWTPSLTFANSDSAIGFGTLSSLFVTYANSTANGSISDTTAHTFTITTSALSGYTLSYLGPTLTSGGNTIAVGTSLATGGTAGTSQFAMSGDLTGTGTGAMQSAYNHNTPLWSYVAGTTTTLATSTGPVTSDAIDMHYLANVASTKAAGDYTTTITFILTGNY